MTGHIIAIVQGIFRGFIAAASLKLGETESGAIIVYIFRGFIAAASLKLWVWVWVFPRLHRRGLIEARRGGGRSST